MLGIPEATWKERVEGEEFNALIDMIHNNLGFKLRNQHVTGRRGEKVMQEQIENIKTKIHILLS